MSACNIKAPNDNPSILHDGLYRYYREAGLEGIEASNYAFKDWVHTNTPSFKQTKSLLKDPNGEPELFMPTQSGEPVALSTMTTAELHKSLAGDISPVFIQMNNGQKVQLSAVRAKPSALQFNKSASIHLQADSDMKTFAEQLSSKFNIRLDFVSEDTARTIFNKEGEQYNGEPAFFSNRQAYAVEGRASKTNLIHEVFGHPFLELLQKEAPHVYNAMISQVMQYDDLKEQIAKDYPGHVNANGAFDETAKKEMILRALELDAKHKLSQVRATGFKSFITRFWNAVKKALGFKDDVTLDSNSTVADLTRIALGDKSIDLSKYSPEGIFRTTLTTDDIAKKITEPGSKIRLEKDALGQEKYVDRDDPTKEIRRGTELVETEFGSLDPAIGKEEIADRKARTEFKKAGLDPDNAAQKITLPNKQQLTFKQLKYNYLRQYNDGQAYGNVGHLVMQMAITGDETLNKQILDWSSMKKLPDDDKIVIRTGFDPELRFSWLHGSDIYEEGGIESFMRQVGLDEEDGVKKLAEFILYNKDLNIASKPDLVTVYPDKEVGLYDFKFGNIDKGNISRLMKYMELDAAKMARASRLDIAYMQLALRAFMMKADNPDIKFKTLNVFKMKPGMNPAMRMNDFLLQDYLTGLKNWIKDTQPELVEKYEKMGLFTGENYFGSTLEHYKMQKEYASKESTDAKLVAANGDKALSTLADAAIGLNAQIETLKQEKGTAPQIARLQEKLAEVGLQFLQLESHTTSAQNLTALTDDLPMKLITDNLNQYDVDQPMLVALKDLENTAEQERTERIVRLKAIKRQLIDDLKREKGITVPRLGVSSINAFGTDYYKGDGTGFWDFMYVEDPAPEGEEGKRVRFISKVADKDKYNALSPAQRAWVEFFNSNVSEAYTKAVVNRKVMDAAGRVTSKAVALGLPESWNDANAMIYVPMMKGEESERAPGIANAIARFGKGLVAGFIRSDYEYGVSYHAGLPVKYMALPDSMKSEKIHSMNTEHIFDTFMTHMYHVELSEPVYAASKGIQIMMEYVKKPDGSLHYKNALDYLKNYVTQHIEARREEHDINVGSIRTKDGQLKHISITRMVEDARLLTTYSTMWFQPILAGINGTLITALNFKAAALNGIGSIAGIKNVDFGPGALTRGIADWVKLKADLTAGTYENNKLYRFLREFKWSPDDFAFFNDKRHMAYVKDGLWDPSHPMVLQQLTEDYGNMSLLSALLHSMKVKAGNKEISVWDAYEVAPEKDAATGKEIKTLKWIAGVRGIVEVPYGDTKRTIKLTKLTAEEIGALKKTSARLTGDYRESERGAADMNALWRMTWQFKRFLNRYSKNMLDGRKEDPALGRYIDTGKTTLDPDIDKEVPILKWERTITEGWGRTITNYFLCTMMYYNVAGFKSLASKLNIDVDQFMEKYKWSNLSDFQKLNVGRAAVNSLLLMAGIASAYALESDEDNFLKRRMQRLFADSSEGANMVDILRSFQKPFPAINKMSNVLQYGTQFVVSAATGDRTRAGELRGQKNLMDQFGPTSFLNQVRSLNK